MDKSPTSDSRTRWISLSLAGLCLIAGSGAQGDDAAPLYRQEPFDQVTLVDKARAEGGDGVYKVRPLPFPRRMVPVDPKPSDKLVVHLHGQREPAELRWGDIERVDLFEQLVLAEARRLSAAGEFDEAFDYFIFLTNRFPKLPGLDDARQDFHYRNAADLFKQGRLPEALALLEEVYTANAERPGLQPAINNVMQRWLTNLEKDGDFAAMRALLSRTVDREGGRKSPLVMSWEQRLQLRAAMHLKQAQDHLTAKRYRQAHQEAAKVSQIWPTLDGAAALSREVAARYPLVRVAVSQSQPLGGVPRSVDRVARRIDRLIYRPPVRLAGIYSDGPRYESPWGTMTVSEDRRTVRIEFAPPADEVGPTPTGYDIAPTLSASAEDWHVDVQAVFSGQIRLPGSHPRPAAKVSRGFIGRSSGEHSPWHGPYGLEEGSAASRYVLPLPPDREATAPVEVSERPTTSGRASIRDLAAGHVDMVERVPPSDLQQVQQIAGVTIGRYAVPSVHVLVPNRDLPHPNNATFRRAMTFAINREAILHEELLAGEDVPGCQVISGPLPIGVDRDDPIGYAYDRGIAPVQHEPALGKTLLEIAEGELAAAAKDNQADPPGRIDEIVIGCADDDLHRLACEKIAEQLTRLGPRYRVEVLSPGDDAAAARCHFVYQELLLTEPLVDLPLLLGEQGLATDDPHLRLALRRLQAATGWQDALDALYEIHRLTHLRRPVIPLYQLVDHFVYRSGVDGITDRPATLYQDIDQWRISPPP